jgi:hypothetical protein
MRTRQCGRSRRTDALVATATGAPGTRRTANLLAAPTTAVVDIDPQRHAALDVTATPRTVISRRHNRHHTRRPRPRGGSVPSQTEDNMSHHYDAAIEAELDRRRVTLRQDAERHQLARLAGRAARTAATRLVRPARTARAAAGREVPGHVHA